MADKSGVALVTGASRGIGPYIARSLAAAGYRLILTSRSAAELQALADELAVRALAGVAARHRAHRRGGEDAVAACNALGLFGGEARLVVVDGVESWKERGVPLGTLLSSSSSQASN